MFGHNRKNSNTGFNLSDDEDEDTFIPISITENSNDKNNNNNNSILINKHQQDEEEEEEEEEDISHRAILLNTINTNSSSNNNNNNDIESLDHHHHFQQHQNLVEVMYRCCFSKVFVKAIALFVGVLGLLLTVILLSVSFASVNNNNNNNPSSNIFSIYPPKLQLPLWVLNLADSNRIKQHVRYLSDDNLQGRLPGSNGEELAVSYIESIFRTSYLEPFGDKGGFRQNVPLYAYRTIPLTEMVFRNIQDGKKMVSLSWKNNVKEFLASTGRQYEQYVNITDVPIVFVGYGIDIKQHGGWNDYEGVDVAGKVVVSLLGFPSDAFGVDTSYTSRWTYKYEEAQRQGALGCIIVHTDESAGYAFSVLENGFVKEQIANDRGVNSTELGLALTSWITKDSASTLAKALGSSLSDWQSMAKAKGFKAIEYPNVGLSLSMEYPSWTFNATNVVAKIPGVVDPDQLIVVMAHHDHLGSYLDTDTNKTIIFNGAMDNASGVGTMLEVATILGHFNKFIHSSTFSEIGPLKSFNRTIVFVSTTAEESGLLGAQHFIKQIMQSLYPLKTPDQVFISSLNFDIVNPLSETKDTVAYGYRLSSPLDTVFKGVCKSEGMEITKDPEPQMNHLFRNDGLAFLRNNITSLTIGIGTKYIGQPENYFLQQYQEYYKQRYHTDLDIFNEAWSFKGAVQQVRLGARLAFYLSSTEADRPPLTKSIY
ncbi:hypothetical protein CYY_001422 [Polysphondylium violaceum]|uniref:Peptidase M28 domain-containing protein n=1 Tax=Polysphondylium violaceum TaxID=133409 RepID=A0A8J4V7Z3_9MYCE|nr:hypothetical protein CYY_001422 [Polysphondylium violaceum]